MIEFGKTLREAREAKGYTVSQIAEMTRMMHQVVEDLEKENFSRIAAPIYGRGFVKLYCEAVGIDHKALVDEFMDIYNGKRELGIKEREVKASPQPAPDPIPAPPPAAPMPTESIPIPPSAVPEAPASLEPSADGGRFARYASPLREMNMPSFSIPPAVWRLASLAIAALVILYFAFAGLRALYRATTESGEETQAPTEETSNAGRTPVKVKSLYID